MSVSAPGDLDRRMMKLALEEGRKGRPSPNPHVGAALVRDAEVVGVAHHERAGLAHAEVAVLRQVGERARGATLYVTFEPCNHHGRTGPCTEAIIAAGVTRVVVGCPDPAPHIPGASARLRAAGIQVDVGVCEDEARQLIEDFTKHITTGLPHVTLKAAVTLDGRMATRRGDSRWITGPAARTEAHRMRDRADAVLVGVGTVLADDPELTVRHVEGADPRRVILDTHLRTPPGAKVLGPCGTGRPILFHGPATDPSRRKELAAAAELVEVPGTGSGLDLERVLRELGRWDVVRLLVEGGPTLHGALLGGGHVDRVAIFVAPRILGDPQALPLAAGGAIERIAEAFRLEDTHVRQLGQDVLFEGRLASAAAAGPEE